MSVLKLDSLTVRRGACPVVDRVSVAVDRGECVGLIGPNGAGKTTMMRAALGLLPHDGRCSLSAMTARACTNLCLDASGQGNLVACQRGNCCRVGTLAAPA